MLVFGECNLPSWERSHIATQSNYPYHPCKVYRVYSIFSYTWLKLLINVGKYTTREWYGLYFKMIFPTSRFGGDATETVEGFFIPHSLRAESTHLVKMGIFPQGSRWTWKNLKFHHLETSVWTHKKQISSENQWQKPTTPIPFDSGSENISTKMKPPNRVMVWFAFHEQPWISMEHVGVMIPY